MLMVHNRLILKGWLPGIIMIVAASLVASCSRDASIIKDYKLYDLDGSNQVIIGNAGMTSVSDITSYDVNGTRIVYETGFVGRADKNGTGDKRLRPCEYGYIDTEKGVVVPAEAGSGLDRMIRAQLAKSRRGVVSRSCVSKS